MFSDRHDIPRLILREFNPLIPGDNKTVTHA